jgi:ABC-type uncharacterized transport system auxiliary subunit
MRTLRFLGLLPLAALCAGCLLGRGEFRPTHYFMLGQEEAKAAANPLPVTASIRRLTSNPRYGQRMVSRTSAVKLEYDEYNRWGENPEDLVGEALTQALRDRRVFASVVGPDVDVPAVVSIEGRVLAFERGPDGNAVCALALVLRRSRDGRPVWSETVTATTPAKGSSAEALAQAMSQSVARIADQCAEAWLKIEELRAPQPAR